LDTQKFCPLFQLRSRMQSACGDLRAALERRRKRKNRPRWNPANTFPKNVRVRLNLDSGVRSFSLKRRVQRVPSIEKAWLMSADVCGKDLTSRPCAKPQISLARASSSHLFVERSLLCLSIELRSSGARLCRAVSRTLLGSTSLRYPHFSDKHLPCGL